MQTDFKKKSYLLIYISLAAVTAAVYLPVRNYDFIRYDDDVYVYKNPNILSGLTLNNIKWAFTTNHAANWHPVTWLSLMADSTVFGAKAGAMHLVNVLFHMANTLLLFAVLKRMTKAFWQSAFIAALFALHPLHVESVAWIAERKDVLSTFFWFLTMLFYVRYAECPSLLRYSVTLLAFGLGLLSKPMLVTLPVILLVIDYWPIGRFSQFTIKKAFIEKIPFLILSVLSSIITFLVQQRGGAVPPEFILPLDTRLANAVCSYLIYIEKMFWPVQLGVLYPYSYNSMTKVLFSAAILIIITVFVIYNLRSRKYLFTGWFWYLITLVPVIGIVQVGIQAYADRYTYIPLTGLFIMAVFGVCDLFKNIAYKKYILITLAAAILLFCAILTSVQLIFWKDSGSLFERTLAVTEKNVFILNNYANVLGAEGKYREAAGYLEQAAAYMPDSPDIHNNYGKALQDLGQLDKAIEQYKTALKIDPANEFARYNLIIALIAKGDLEGAIGECRIALGSNPNDFEMQNRLGGLLQKQGKLNEAIDCYRKALEINPDYKEARENLASVLSQRDSAK